MANFFFSYKGICHTNFFFDMLFQEKFSMKSFEKKSFTVYEKKFSIESYSTLNIPICIPSSLVFWVSI